MPTAAPGILPVLLALSAAAVADGAGRAPAPAPVQLSGPGVTGTVVRYPSLQSAHVAPRHIDVWLPPGYRKDTTQRYPVLYMQDGQNLFDPATSYGGAGCVSTHWPAGDGIALDDFGAHLPDPATHKYWFDYGTATLDAAYEPYQKRADEMLRKAGYSEGRNWSTRRFEGAEHSEKAWRVRVHQPLEFLLGR